MHTPELWLTGLPDDYAAKTPEGFFVDKAGCHCTHGRTQLTCRHCVVAAMRAYGDARVAVELEDLKRLCVTMLKRIRRIRKKEARQLCTVFDVRMIDLRDGQIDALYQVLEAVRARSKGGKP